MKTGVNCWTFPRGTPLAAAAREARAAGFDCIEPTVEAEGELTPSTGEEDCRRLAEAIRAEGVEIASLASGLFWATPFTAPDSKVRRQALQLAVACLERARWMGAPVVLVVPGMVTHPKTNEFLCSYQDALLHCLQALQELVPEAERRDVRVGIENVWNGFLVSPVELREMLDRVNSSWVGAYFDTGNVVRYGVPQDWIRTLGARILRVHLKDYDARIGGRQGFCRLGEGTVDWAAVMGALRRTHYDGPLIFEGPGELSDIRQRVERVMSAG